TSASETPDPGKSPSQPSNSSRFILLSVAQGCKLSEAGTEGRSTTPRRGRMGWDACPTGAVSMIESLRLERFKNFQDATMKLGPFTVLIGANASGKSNIRDAFRFLHGIGRGYSLAEILGEKYQGGERVWSGIRGGTREIAFSGSDLFTIGIR